jgi:hypothetical protein
MITKNTDTHHLHINRYRIYFFTSLFACIAFKIYLLNYSSIIKNDFSFAVFMELMFIAAVIIAYHKLYKSTSIILPRISSSLDIWDYMEGLPADQFQLIKRANEIYNTDKFNAAVQSNMDLPAWSKMKVFTRPASTEQKS